jgi:hypothetical protein
MRLTRTELKQIAGHFWSIDYNDPILNKFRKYINEVGPALRDSVPVEFTEAESAKVEEAKRRLKLK